MFRSGEIESVGTLRPRSENPLSTTLHWMHPDPISLASNEPAYMMQKVPATPGLWVRLRVSPSPVVLHTEVAHARYPSRMMKHQPRTAPGRLFIRSKAAAQLRVWRATMATMPTLSTQIHTHSPFQRLCRPVLPSWLGLGSTRSVTARCT